MNDKLDMILFGRTNAPTHPLFQLIHSIPLTRKRLMNAQIVDPYTLNTLNPVMCDEHNEALIDKMKSFNEHCLITVKFNQTTKYLTFRLHSSNIESQEVTCNMDVVLSDNPVIKLLDSHFTGTPLDQEDKEVLEQRAQEEQWYLDNELLTPTQVEILESVRHTNNYMKAMAAINKVFPDKKCKTLQGAKKFAGQTVNENYYHTTQLKGG